MKELRALLGIELDEVSAKEKLISIVSGLIAIGSLVLLFAVALNAWFPWRRYPAHLARRPAHGADESSHAAVVAALRKMHSFIDVSEEDLVELYELVRAEMTTLSGRDGVGGVEVERMPGVT